MWKREAVWLPASLCFPVRPGHSHGVTHQSRIERVENVDRAVSAWNFGLDQFGAVHVGAFAADVNVKLYSHQRSCRLQAGSVVGRDAAAGDVVSQKKVHGGTVD